MADIIKEMPPILSRFALYQRNVKGLSANTVNEYCLDLRTFFRFMKNFRGLVPEDTPINKIKISDIDLDFIHSVKTYDIFEFMNYVSDKRNNQNSTRQRKSTTLRSFFKYLHSHEGLIEENPAENLVSPKKKKALPRHLSLEQSVGLLEVADRDSGNHERDYCILMLFLNCGMRLSELVALNLTDVQGSMASESSVLKIIGKGNKERIVYLNQACVSAIDRYLKVRPHEGIDSENKNALFISRLKKRISPKTVQYIVKKYLKEIGLPEYSVHKLRHTAATLMYQHGNVDIRVLQDILGHENLGTTEIYTHTSSSQIESAIDSNPLNRLSIHESKKDNNGNNK